MGISRSQAEEARFYGNAKGGRVLTVEASDNLTDELPEGVYRIAATVELWYRVGGSAVAVDITPSLTADNTTCYLGAGEVDYVLIEGSTNRHIVVQRGGTSDGLASVSRVEKG